MQEVKPTLTNIANYYGLTRQTIASYRDAKPKVYNALLNEFIRVHYKIES